MKHKAKSVPAFLGEVVFIVYSDFMSSNIQQNIVYLICLLLLDLYCGIPGSYKNVKMISF
jgi:hypothetical protein